MRPNLIGYGLLFLAFIGLSSSCRPDLGRDRAPSPESSINIILLDASDLRGGETVTVRGVPVGTAMKPRLVNDRAVVTARLDRDKVRREDIARCTVFTVGVEQLSRKKATLTGRGPNPGEGENSATCIDGAFLGGRDQTIDAVMHGADLVRDIAQILRQLQR